MILTALCALFFCCALMNVFFWPPLGRRRELGQVSVLVPARNEAANIAECLESIVAQGAVVRELLVYDDHSTDGTARLLTSFGIQEPRLHVIESEPLPAGWCGKNFGCDRLARAAGSEWLLFLDADARLAEYAIERMLSEVRRRNATMLSCWPALKTVSLWEKLLMPMLNFVVFTLFPAPLALRRMDPSLGLAHGACLLLHSETYRALGGHAAVRAEIFEDTRLAQLWRSKGHRSICLEGGHAIQARMYGSLPEIWTGFQKNFYPAFRRTSSFWVFIAFHFALFLLPFLMLNWTAIALVLAARAVLAVRFGQAWWSVLLHPIAEAITIALGVSSWWRCCTGKGVAWKDRVYRAT